MKKRNKSIAKFNEAIAENIPMNIPTRENEEELLKDIENSHEGMKRAAESSLDTKTEIIRNFKISEKSERLLKEKQEMYEQIAAPRKT